METDKKKYKILISDKTYTAWSFIDPVTNMSITTDMDDRLKYVNPVENKLFSRDIFVFDDDDDPIEICRKDQKPSTTKPTIRVVQAYLKNCHAIAGVLMLENNKTFGRTANKKRLLYKCIPDDRHFPPFLVPYDIKPGFSKVLKNKYILFRFDNWNDKHPIGTIVETIGDVDRLDTFYEFQLHSKSLHISLTDFTNKTREQLNKKTSEEYVNLILKSPEYKIENRLGESIITIDNKNSCDYDDGYGIVQVSDNKWRITVYIANVYIWLEVLGLWKTFSKRVSTIYLPDRRRPMLPTILSDTLCSLQEDQLRFAMAFDIFVDMDGNIYKEESRFQNVLIKVKKNHIYESPLLVKDPTYKQLHAISSRIDPTTVNSHDVVSQWMIYMNTVTSEKMMENQFGIFRSLKYIETSSDEMNMVDDETKRIIKFWNNTIGQYIQYEDGVFMEHDILKTKSYTHITSPIRRLIDLLNQIMIFKEFKIVHSISQNAVDFLNDWLLQIDYINTTMRSIRKIQTDCALLDRCFNDPTIMDKSYNGTIFDKIPRLNGTINYMVYLHDLKLLSRISHSYIDLQNYHQYQFKIYLFEDEDKIRKKIKVVPIM